MGGSSCIGLKYDVGYDSNKEKVHKLCVTKCLEKLKKWKRAIISLKHSCKYSSAQKTLVNFQQDIGPKHTSYNSLADPAERTVIEYSDRFLTVL